MEMIRVAPPQRVRPAGIPIITKMDLETNVTAAKTIAIVEDEVDQLRNCADALSARGYQVQTYSSRAEALRGFERKLPDMAILDIVLGDDHEGGYEVCRHLLRRQHDLPVIFLSALSDDIHQVAGLKMGAWDYQTKPVSFVILAEKVSTLFRLRDRGPASDSSSLLRLGDLTVDEDGVEARWKGERLDLTLTEFRVLVALAHRAGRVATYESLMESSLEAIVTRNTVNTHIMRLRKKLQAIDSGFASIRNEYGLGYRWVD